MSALVFYSLSAVVLISALGVVLLKNTLHSALLLGLCLAGVAGVFASLGADFLFSSQLLIYVGGIAVLLLFVVMLSGRSSELKLRQVNDQWLAALLICAVTFLGMRRYIFEAGTAVLTASPQPTTAALGKLLLGEYAVPFEAVSLILIAALVGAVVFSKARERKP
ncbi:MAG: NADH-quinone oxidoreductase subunit J [Elusimicrobia bacterium]|nr:NADH-quinone oxidoreductase subunit J [Elusimicrobiota bacterium]